MTRFPIVIAACVFATAMRPPATQPGESPAQAREHLSIPARERLSINGDWRFKKDDPPVIPGGLLYDVRPEVTDDRDDRPADAEPTAAARVRPSVAAIKPWILPTANPFIKDPTRRHARPSGNLDVEIEYLTRDFDDSAWRLVDLPHDWGIEGPFLTSGPHGGMGRLPSWGVAWYRKKLNVPRQADREHRERRHGESHERDVFNGLVLAIVRARKGATGQISVTASAEGLRNAVTMIRATRR